MEQFKYLVLKGCAGLGNRLITLMKAINLCNKTGRILYVDWNDGTYGKKESNVFFKYFDLKNVNYIKENKPIVDLFNRGCSTFPEKLTLEELVGTKIDKYDVVTPLISRLYPYKFIATCLFKERYAYFMGLQSLQRRGNGVHTYFDAIKSRNNGDNIPLGGALTIQHKEDILLFIDFRPVVNIENLFNYLTLKPQYKRKIDEYADEHGIRDSIGVHIRYTDKKPLSKITRLIKVLEKKLDITPHQKIFLCTDNNDVTEEFKAIFGDSIIQTPKYIPQTEGEGIHAWARENLSEETKDKMMEECLMDMWLLGMTKILYWQGNSSFSYISKYIKNDSKTTYNWMGILNTL